MEITARKSHEKLPLNEASQARLFRKLTFQYQFKRRFDDFIITELNVLL